MEIERRASTALERQCDEYYSMCELGRGDHQASKHISHIHANCSNEVLHLILVEAAGVALVSPKGASIT